MTAQAGIALATQGVSGVAALIGLSPGVIALLPKILPALKALPFLGLGAVGIAMKGAATGIMAFGAALIPLALNPAFWAIAGILAAIGGAGYIIWKNWKPISDFFTNFFRTVLNGLEAVTSSIAKLFGLLSASPKISTPFDPAGLNNPLGQKSPVQATGASSLGLSIGNWLGGLFSGGSKAGGNIPGSFVSMIDSEMRQKPSGSGLVVANDSEVILNRSQQRGVAQAIAGNSGGKSMSVTININGFTGSINDLASSVKSAIEQQWSNMIYEDA
jgi:hypothetical protein